MSTSTVTFSSAGGQSQGYLAQPDGAGANASGLVVIQEWYGLVPHIEDIARRLAKQGYMALAPDLYHGQKAQDDGEAERLMKALDWGLAAQELAGAVAYLRAHGSRRVGIVGFCMGGALTLVGAAQGHVDGYASFYGFPSAGGAPVDRITAPGLIFFGEHENFFSVPDARAFAARQAARGIATELVVYPGAGHAFFRDTDPDVYRADAAADAWRRTLAFFGEQLKA